MPLLAGLAYDPAVAAAGPNALATMAALDATNLALTFTVPASGRVQVRLACVLSGATTYSQVLLGVMQGTTVIKRMAPMGAPQGTAIASTKVPLEAVFLVTGLTPGASLTWLAAAQNEVHVASSQIRWGGPNDATTTNAWGAFCFEIWDVG